MADELYVVKHAECDLWIAERAGTWARWGTRAEAMTMSKEELESVLSENRALLTFERCPHSDDLKTIADRVKEETSVSAYLILADFALAVLAARDKARDLGDEEYSDADEFLVLVDAAIERAGR